MCQEAEPQTQSVQNHLQPWRKKMVFSVFLRRVVCKDRSTENMGCLQVTYPHLRSILSVQSLSEYRDPRDCDVLLSILGRRAELYDS